MKRKIISIDEDKCTGCGLCVDACHEGALAMVDGKAKLVSESYCDGLGDCLPECPTGAITIEEREAEDYDKDAVDKHMTQKRTAGGCPSMQTTVMKQHVPVAAAADDAVSELAQWPCQIKLVPVGAPYFDGARLLVAADCTAFSRADVHSRFMRGKITLIGCPKLDMTDYSDKLAEIIRHNDIKSIEVLRMSVPCCGGLENAVKRALVSSGKMVPWRVTVIAPDGSIVED